MIARLNIRLARHARHAHASERKVEGGRLGIYSETRRNTGRERGCGLASCQPADHREGDRVVTGRLATLPLAAGAMYRWAGYDRAVSGRCDRRCGGVATPSGRHRR
jgi:hypothetical protein